VKELNLKVFIFAAFAKLSRPFVGWAEPLNDISFYPQELNIEAKSGQYQ
jgi:hypothetical protein